VHRGRRMTHYRTQVWATKSKKKVKNITLTHIFIFFTESYFFFMFEDCFTTIREALKKKDSFSSHFSFLKLGESWLNSKHADCGSLVRTSRCLSSPRFLALFRRWFLHKHKTRVLSLVNGQYFGTVALMRRFGFLYPPQTRTMEGINSVGCGN